MVVNIVHQGWKHVELKSLGCLPNFCNLYDLAGDSRDVFLSEEDNERQVRGLRLVCQLFLRKLFPFGDCLGKTVNVFGESLRRRW